MSDDNYGIIGGDGGTNDSQPQAFDFDSTAGNGNSAGFPSNFGSGNSFQQTMNTGTNRFEFSLPKLTFAHALNKQYPGLVDQDFLNNGYDHVRNTYAINLSAAPEQREEEKARKAGQDGWKDEVDNEVDWWTKGPQPDKTRPATEKEIEAAKNDDATLWPAWVATNAMAQAGIMGPAGPQAAGLGALSGAASAILGGIPQGWRDRAGEVQRQRGKPDLDKMTPQEIEQYYGQ